MSKLTTWFSVDQKPVRDGWYRVRLWPDWNVICLKWSDNSFWMPNNLFQRPSRLKTVNWPMMEWRGLTETAYREALRRRKD